MKRESAIPCRIFKADGIPLLSVTLKADACPPLPWLQKEAEDAFLSLVAYAETVLFPALSERYAQHPSHRKRFTVRPLSLCLTVSATEEAYSAPASIATAAVAPVFSYALYAKGRLIRQEKHISLRDRETGLPLPPKKPKKAARPKRHASASPSQKAP